MKYLILSAICLMLMSCNPQNKSSPKDLEASTSEDGLMNGGSGLTTEQINPSPNPAPASEAEVIDNSVLTNKPVKDTPDKNEIQAEEDAMDYSTTPEKKIKPQEEREDSGVDQDTIGN